MTTHFVFLHGGGQGSWIWNETIDALKIQSHDDVARYLSLDIPGCGQKRERVTDNISAADIVAELLADIDRAGITDAVLVGHSQAGTILPLLIKARPMLFQHVVYVSCLIPQGQQTALTWRDEMPAADSALFADRKPGSREFFDSAFCNDMQPTAADAFLDKLGFDRWPASSYQMADWAYEHLATSPSTYVQCLRDAILPMQWQHMFAERVHAKNIVRIDAGHQVMNTRPHALAEVLRAIES
jgi:pimeloyl-ACP methyl ester carboxylesterase